MSEIKAIYLPYYRETDAKKRADILKELSEDPECDPRELSVIRNISGFRYGTGKKALDRFLGQCLNLIYLNRSLSPVSLFAKRKIREAKRELMLEEPADPFMEPFLYQEYKNTALTYLKTCEDSDYASYFGIMKAGDDTKRSRIARDLFEMTDGFCGQFRAGEEFSLWNRALKEAFFASRPDIKERFEEYSQKRS
ncbi:MAG: hypothetical protein K6F53_01885 [Lachnospiraceae bacterium]|nr:hypothetical protein [Lachnospiraceae bacterium]